MLRSRPAKPIPAGSSFLKHPLAMSKRRLATDAHGCTRIKKEISYPCSPRTGPTVQSTAWNRPGGAVRGSSVFIRGSNWVRFLWRVSRFGSDLPGMGSTQNWVRFVPLAPCHGSALLRTGSAQNWVRFFRSATLRRLAMGPGGCASIENRIDDPCSSAFIRGSDWVRFVLAESCRGSTATDGWQFVRLLCSGNYPKPRLSQGLQLAGRRDK
jgi:hypothetical protein